ncbi:MAG: hydroxymethylglutaryl-CoA synthase [Candidatus Bathyarchaeia archaeon]
MKTQSPVGIVGYGAYIPVYRLRTSEIARIWGRADEYLPVEEVSVASLDEDAVTIAVEASRHALKRCDVNPYDIGAVYFGSESKPYAVKSCGATVAEAIGASPNMTAADYEFACKAGSEAIQTCVGLVGSGMIRYGLAIGVDTAQSAPSDELEYASACGGAAFIIGHKSQDTVAYFEGSTSYVTDTPDFWRRATQSYPSHGVRFTGDPAYFRHTLNASKNLMGELNLRPEDFDYAVFHQPNAKFPVKAAIMLGFTRKQLEPGLLAPLLGNTYAGSSLLGLASVLDVAKSGQRILLVSYGSGSGSDAFSMVVQDRNGNGKVGLSVSQLLKHKKYIDYAQYVRYRHKLQT